VTMACQRSVAADDGDAEALGDRSSRCDSWLDGSPDSSRYPAPGGEADTVASSFSAGSAGRRPHCGDQHGLLAEGVECGSTWSMVLAGDHVLGDAVDGDRFRSQRPARINQLLEAFRPQQRPLTMRRRRTG